MKICHISTGFPISFQGGVTNYVRTLAEYQISQGHEVYVISGPDSGNFSFKVKEYKSDKITPMKWRAPIDKDGLIILKSFFENNGFDLIHIHMMLDIDWDIYEIIKDYKYIISLHDYFFICPRIQMLMHDNKICTSYEEKKCMHCISLFNTIRLTNALEYKISHYTSLRNFRFPEIPSKMTKERYKRFKKLLENASFLLPVSNRVKEIFINSGINGNYRVMHIGNVTADRYEPHYEFDENKKVIDIAMLGTLTYSKGADIFIEIAKKVNRNNVAFHFYGRSGKYSEAIRKSGIIDHGPYNQKELPDILKNIDFGMCLSVWEDNGPQVVMEFLNNHIPVIGTKLGGIPDFVKDGHNGILFNPFDESEVHGLIDKINNMDIQELKRMTSNVERTTTTQEHCIDMDSVYREAMNA